MRSEKLGTLWGVVMVSSMGMSKAPPLASVMKGRLAVVRPIGHTETQNTSSVA